MRLAWQPIFEREWEQNRERFQIGKSLHLKEKNISANKPLTNPLMGGVLRFSFSNLSFLWTFVWLGCEFSCFRLAYAYNWIVHFLMC